MDLMLVLALVEVIGQLVISVHCYERVSRMEDSHVSLRPLKFEVRGKSKKLTSKRRWLCMWRMNS